MTCDPSKHTESLRGKGKRSVKGRPSLRTHLVIEHKQVIVKYQSDCADTNVLNLGSVLVLNSTSFTEQTSSVQLAITS